MAAIMLGVVTLGLSLASVVLDRLTRQPGTGGPAADAFVAAVAVVPVTLMGTLLAARAIRSGGLITVRAFLRR